MGVRIEFLQELFQMIVFKWEKFLPARRKYNVVVDQTGIRDDPAFLVLGLAKTMKMSVSLFTDKESKATTTVITLDPSVSSFSLLDHPWNRDRCNPNVFLRSVHIYYKDIFNGPTFFINLG